MQTTTNHPAQTPLWLAATTLAAFATGTDDMVIAGLLPELATDLGVGEPAAGQLITAYSLTYGLGAPVLAVLTAHLPRRRFLVAATLVFALVNVLMAVAPNYPVLMALRVAAALAAAAIVPTALALVAEQAPTGRRGRWLSTVTAGVTLSLIAGVPIGTWIAAFFDWRATMLFVAVLAALAAAGMSRVPESTPTATETLGGRLAPLTRPTILAVSVSMLIAGSGGMMGYIYLAPVSRHLTDSGPGALGLLILVFGTAGFAGVLLGGRGSDTIGPGPTLAAGIAVAAVMITLIALAANTVPTGTVPFLALASATAVWAVGIWSVSPPVQSWLLPRARGMEGAVLALNTSGMYLGFSVGGAVGGAVLAAWGAAAVPVASAALLAVGGLAMAGSFRMGARDGRPEDADR